MHIEVTKQPKSIVFVKGSLPASDFDGYIGNATRKFVADAELPGFRKGKAPEKMVVEKIGEIAILEEATNDALAKSYPVILKDHNINAIGHPQIRITKLARGNALEFEAEIAVLPEFDLPDYKKLAQGKNTEPKEEITVSDEELQKTLDWLRKSSSFRKRSEDKRSAVETAGNDTELPPLTDEFAQSVGNFKTVDELKNAIRENMKFEKDEKARDKRHADLLDTICSNIAMDLPDVLVAAEKEKMAAELKNGVASMGMAWDAYLAAIKKTEDELKRGWQEDAERRIKSILALKKIAEREHIEPMDDELNAWVYQYLSARTDEEKKDIDQERVKEYAYGVIKNQKVFEFLENITE